MAASSTNPAAGIFNAAAIMQKLNGILDILDEETAPGHTLHFDILDTAAARTKLRRAHIALGAVVSIMLFVFVGFGASFFSSLIGFLYPMYASMKAINTPDNKDDKQWLTYWVVFAVFSLVESVSDRLLFWFPMYYSLKIIFLIFLQLPYYNGAAFLYDKFIGPWFVRNQHAIEGSLSQMRVTAVGIAERAGLNSRPVEPMVDHLPIAANIPLDQIFEGYPTVPVHGGAGASATPADYAGKKAT